GNCKPFKGFGAHPRNIGKVISSFYFRVKSVSNNCCAVIELLKDPNDTNHNPHCPTEQQTKNLRATGICITVDAKCFCHITCLDRKSTRLNSSHVSISYAVFCLKKKK